MNAIELKVGQRFKFVNRNWTFFLRNGQLSYKQNEYDDPQQDAVLMKLDQISEESNDLAYVIMEPPELRGYMSNMGTHAQVVSVD